jgi:hypothetical protein
MKSLRVFLSRRLLRAFQSERSPDGRVVKRLKKCYPCPDLYSYVSSTHGDLGLTFRDLAERARVSGGPCQGP